MLTARPAYITVHYDTGDGPTFADGHMHADQPDDGIALVLVERAWQDRNVCRRVIPGAAVSRIEVHRAPYTPNIVEQMVDANRLTPWEQLVHVTLVAHGGPVQWTCVPDILDDAGRAIFEPGQVNTILQSLKAKGRIRLVHSAGLDSGVIHIL